MRSSWPVAGLALGLGCGAFFVAAAVTSGGSDLRPAGGDLQTVLSDRSHTVQERRTEVVSLQREIDQLGAKASGARLDELRATVDALKPAAGFTKVKGSGMRITLTDAPRSSDASGVNPNLLVVHQQDIQAFVNALWAGGAEAVTLQGQRLISTTGIKCVGNTVVLDGVPYAPPYVIEAVGDVYAMTIALDASPEVVTYGDYAERYDLGLEQESVDEIVAPAYRGSVSLSHAESLG